MLRVSTAFYIPSVARIKRVEQRDRDEFPIAISEDTICDKHTLPSARYSRAQQRTLDPLAFGIGMRGRQNVPLKLRIGVTCYLGR